VGAEALEPRIRTPITDAGSLVESVTGPIVDKSMKVPPSLGEPHAQAGPRRPQRGILVIPASRFHPSLLVASHSQSEGQSHISSHFGPEEVQDTDERGQRLRTPSVPSSPRASDQHLPPS
jgi:hypothetical protein